MIDTLFGLLVGLILGLVIDRRARKERDQRISELEQAIEQLKETAPVRVSEDAFRSFEAGEGR